MKFTTAILLLAASTVAATAQTPAKPAAPAAATAKSAATAAKPAVPAAKAAPATSPTVAPIIKAPASLKPQYTTPQKSIFTVALRYQDGKIGDGAEAESGKRLKYHFTIYLAATGDKFDSTYDHPGPTLKDKDGKPVLGDDGKPKPGDPNPFSAVRGSGNPLPGIDMGLEGMKVNGKRRIFIPWQFGLGNRDIPARAGRPAVPAKSDLIVDVDLLDVADLPTPQPQPAMQPNVHPAPPAGAQPAPAAPSATPTPAAPAPQPSALKPVPPAPPATAPAPPVAPAAPQQK
jgi:FKBP-type peptidyl-prolyl cis-trans isomerase